MISAQLLLRISPARTELKSSAELILKTQSRFYFVKTAFFMPTFTPEI